MRAATFSKWLANGVSELDRAYTEVRELLP